MTAGIPGLPSGWRSVPVRYLSRNLDYLRIPKNAVERAEMEGLIPYWGANSVQGYVDRALVDGPIVLVGEDGAPFFDPLATVAFAIDEPIWPNNHVHVLRPNQGVDHRFLAYALNAVDYSLYVKGSTRDKLNQSELSGILVATPQHAEQVVVADFLDRETAEIDAFIADQGELIGLLTERRAATITHAVTKGLDHSAPTKRSGIDWLGDIPRVWRIRPLWSLFARIKDVGHPHERMLSVFREHGVVYKDDFENINKTAENRNIYQLVGPGWLVANRMKAWQGSVGVSRYRGIVSGHYICFAPRHQESSAFLNYLFRSAAYAAGYSALSRGVRIGQAEIDNDQYRLLPVLLPPPADQMAIVDYLDRETAELDAAIADAREAIALSRERRAALISAAVTGKIDVRGAA